MSDIEEKITQKIYDDIRESLELILRELLFGETWITFNGKNVNDILSSLDDAVSNNFDELTKHFSDVYFESL